MGAGCNLVGFVQQGLAIGETRQDHHHQAAAEDADDHLAHPGLGDVEDMLRVGQVDAGRWRRYSPPGRNRRNVVLMVVGDVGPTLIELYNFLKHLFPKNISNLAQARLIKALALGKSIMALAVCRSASEGLGPLNLKKSLIISIRHIVSAKG